MLTRRLRSNHQADTNECWQPQCNHEEEDYVNVLDANNHNNNIAKSMTSKWVKHHKHQWNVSKVPSNCHRHSVFEVTQLVSSFHLLCLKKFLDGDWSGCQYEEYIMSISLNSRVLVLKVVREQAYHSTIRGASTKLAFDARSRWMQISMNTHPFMSDACWNAIDLPVDIVGVIREFLVSIDEKEIVNHDKYTQLLIQNADDVITYNDTNIKRASRRLHCLHYSAIKRFLGLIVEFMAEVYKH